MKKSLAALCLLLILALPAVAEEGDDVRYIGGTVTTLKDGMLGKLDAKSQTELTFDSSGTRLAVPFARIDSYEHTRQVAHHLGVLPAIAVSLVKKRERRHFLQIAYHDEDDAPHVAIFEVPKKMPRILLAILQQRAPQGCKPRAYEKCSIQD